MASIHLTIKTEMDTFFAADTSGSHAEAPTRKPKSEVKRVVDSPRKSTMRSIALNSGQNDRVQDAVVRHW